jgi:hypothetical protein
VVGQGYIVRSRKTKGDYVTFEYDQGASHTQASALGIGLSGYGVDAGPSGRLCASRPEKGCLALASPTTPIRSPAILPLYSLPSSTRSLRRSGAISSADLIRPLS